MRLHPDHRVAGPVANLLLAAVLYVAVASIAGVTTFVPIANAIEANSPAAIAFFQPDDRILAVAGQPTATFDALRPILRNNLGQTLAFTVDRGGAHRQLIATLAAIHEDGRVIGPLGITSRVSFQRHVGCLEAASLGVSGTWNTIAETLEAFTVPPRDLARDAPGKRGRMARSSRRRSIHSGRCSR